jgi:hypothetical protein
MKRGTTFFLIAAIAAALVGCKGPLVNNLPPAPMLLHPGPGVDGPGPGVMQYSPPPAVGPGATSQVSFVGPDGLQVSWATSMPGMFDSMPLVAPARQNFQQGAIYRLKVTRIPGHEGSELYPTLEVAPAMPRTDAFLAHNAIPVQFTPEDFDQVLGGNFVTKVIYLPDPEFQDLAVAGVETLVSTRLDPGLDPIVEADRRGAILAVVRLGNKDLRGPTPMEGDEVIQASYQLPCDGGAVMGQPTGVPTASANAIPIGYVSGVNCPQYGLPTCGTPIGLPGPPHVPLGNPAGLRKHTIRNYTHTRIPGPTKKIAIGVRQSPGLSYPKPASHAYVVEKTRPGLTLFHKPCDKQVICDPACPVPCETPCMSCPDAACPMPAQTCE